MGIVIRLQRSGGGHGDTTSLRVVTSNGTVLGWVEPTAYRRFAARVPWGHAIPGWLAQGDTGSFASVTDAAAAVWLGFISRPLLPHDGSYPRGSANDD
jgi:hypothetical protein